MMCLFFESYYPQYNIYTLNPQRRKEHKGFFLVSLVAWWNNKQIYYSLQIVEKHSPQRHKKHKVFFLSELSGLVG
jgi:hypothetical protein